MYKVSGDPIKDLKWLKKWQTWQKCSFWAEFDWDPKILYPFFFPDSESLFNKAVYTTASVAYGWAGAVMQIVSPFGIRYVFAQRDGPTVGPID